MLFVYSWDPGEITRAETLFFVATTARAMGLDVAIFCFADGVMLGKKGIVEKISDKAALGMLDAMSTGVKIYLCSTAVKTKGIENDLIDGVELVGYATFLEMALNAKTVITI